MTDIVFIDTETTGLHPEQHRIWEFAGIKKNVESGEESRMLLQIDVDVHMGNADPFALNIGKFWERYGKNGVWDPAIVEVDEKPIHNPIPQNGELCSDIAAARFIREFTHGAHLIGNCVGFDTERMGLLLRENFQLPTWHYHVIDIEPILVGYAKAKGVNFPLPYSSSDLSKWLGVEEPADEKRHTAMGDAEWVKAQWEALGL